MKKIIIGLDITLFILPFLISFFKIFELDVPVIKNHIANSSFYEIFVIPMLSLVVLEVFNFKYDYDSFKNKNVVISGSGNVAQYAAEKAISLGAKVLTMSDSSGFIYDNNGIDEKKLEYIMNLKNFKRGRISEYVKKYPKSTFNKGQKPWSTPCDIALPCATQNELDENDAKKLISNGCSCVSEGANMPSTKDAIEVFHKSKILFAPGKASNAGGVATSGLEMTQNSLRYHWSREEVDEKLKDIMFNIHNSCIEYGKQDNGYIDYVKGANIAGFVKVADAMLAQGIV